MGPETPANQPSHVINQAIGLLVFLGGVALLAGVFLWAYHLYAGIDAGLLHVQATQARPAVHGLAPGPALPPGALSTQPQSQTSLVALVLGLFAKLLILLVMGWVGALIASKGISLAVGPPRARRSDA